MQPTSYEIKKAAKNALSSRWPEAILVFVSFISVCLLNIYSQALLMSVFKVESVWSPLYPAELPKLNVIASIGITVFSALFSLLITAPFALGMLKWFWSFTNQSNAKLYEVFHFFSSGKLFRKAVSFGLNIYIRIIITAIVCLAPYIICNVLQSPTFYELLGAETPPAASALYAAADFLKLLGVLATLALSSKYLLFGAPVFAQPELTAWQAIKMARKVSRGETLKLLGFLLSFAWWAALSLLIVPLIFVGPYFISCISIYSRETIREYEQKEEILKN